MLIFYLGGGTFDVTLLTIKEGILIIPMKANPPIQMLIVYKKSIS